MKKLITLMIMTLCAATLFAQAPEKFSYQAVVRNTNNALVTNAPVSVRVSILQGGADGEALYVETHSAVTNANGLLTLEIGGGKAEQGAFDRIDWAHGPFFLKTETDPNGGDSYSITVTQQLLSVPYALYAKEAANVFSGDYNDLKNKPAIPQNVGELTNDAGYITLNDLPAQSKGGDSPKSAGVIQTDSCGDIDLCALESRIARMEAALQPTVTTASVGNTTETTATCGGTVTDGGYDAVTARGVCWATEPNPTVADSHTSDGIGTGTFNSSISGLTAGTTYYVRAYATNSVGTSYGEEVTFTTSEEQPQDTCPTITLPYSENFDSYTTSTAAATGVEPTCWELVQEDVAMTNANRPQLCYKSSFAHSGNYSLKLGYRGVYAMPALSEDVDLNQVQLEMYLRQANAAYQLEVGVWEENGTFVPVALINNSTTNVEHVECDFSNYNGNARRIAFRNVLGGGANYNYSYNYIDDIMLSLVVPVGGDTLTQDTCTIQTLPYSENFDSYTTSTTAATGVEPTCWELVQEDVAMTAANRPQLYYKSSYAHSGSYSLLLNYRGVYAMPALSEDVPVNQVKLEMYLRQPKSYYLLEVGVLEENGTFVSVAQFNNSTTNVEPVECDFSNYSGNARRIAFRNVLGGGANYNYSYNYIDDITLTLLGGVADDTQPCPGAETVTDIDGNVYNTVQIGEQCWMRQNLRTTKFADGTPIPNGGEAVSTTDPYYYDYASSGLDIAERGYLYNWVAVMHGTISSSAIPSNVQGVCPTGWHVPSNAEWLQLVGYVGSVPDYVCGGNSGYIAKALASTSGWNPNTGTCAVGNDLTTNNASGFSAVPAGYCNGASFYAANDNSQFWSSTEYSGSNAWYYNLSNGGAEVNRNISSKGNGRSVRCLRGAGLNAPAVTTGEVSEVTPTTAVCGGVVVSDGGMENTERGVCWGTEPNPTLSDSHTSAGSGMGAFTCSITGLIPIVTYYVRAYATNSMGTSYGETVTFTTADTCTTITLPYTEDFESYTSTTTASTGVQPYCWKLVQEDVSMTDGTLPQLYYKSSFAHSGNYSLKMSNRCVYAMPALSADIPLNRVRLEMYLRQANAAYQLEAGVWDDETGAFVPVATFNNSTTGVMRVECDFSNYTGNGRRIAFRNVLGNGANYAYSYNYLDDITLDTVSGGAVSATLPTVSTSAVSNITENTATCGGAVTDDGYAEVTGRGVCWGTVANPTVEGSHTSNGSGTGTFTSSITGLAANTTYYVRAYATNSVGTAYGETVSFTTTEVSTCGITITLPYSEDFESYTTVTTASTGVQPDCWSLTQAYVSMTDATRPQLYYNSNSAHSGSYSLRMGNRCVYAMPALSMDIPLNWVRLDMYLRQTNDAYQLEVGVWEEDGTFVPVATFNNSTTDVEHVICVFSNYSGNGRRIAFRNVLGGDANYDYSYNYIDDISLSTTFVVDEKSCPGNEMVTDIDGNVYSTVQIGEQCWMRENLRTTHYADGTAISAGGDNWSYTEPYYYVNSDVDASVYGYYYNWPAAMNGAASSNANPSGVQGICPTGWHLPSDAEWTQLTDYVGGQSEYTCGGSSSNIAKALASTEGWNTSTGSCTVGNDQTSNNASGFSVVPAGYWDYGFDIDIAGDYANFWSSTEYGTTYAWSRYLGYDYAYVGRGYGYRYYGFSVRCLRD